MEASQVEEDVWESARAGDGEAFGRIFDLHESRIHAHAGRLLAERSDVEDAVATAFLELWRRRDVVRLVNGSVLAWLIVTTTNVCRNLRRASRRYRAMLERLPREPDRLAAEQWPASAQLVPLDPFWIRHIKSLHATDRALVSLVIIEGFPVAEAARLAGVTESAAKSRLHRFRHRARSAMPPVQEGSFS